MKTKKKILICGAYGFIGKNICKSLNEEYDIFSVGRISNNSNSEDFLNNVTHLCDDISDFKIQFLVENQFNTILWLIHNSVPASNEPLWHKMEMDCKPLIRFIQFCTDAKFKGKLLYFSSGGTVYGYNGFNTCNEEVELNPKSDYGLSKVYNEQFLKHYSYKDDFKIIILRPSNVYGPLQKINKPQGIVPHTFSAIKEKKKLKVSNSGKTIRDYLHVYDLVDFIKIIINKNIHTLFSTYNVGTSVGTSTSEIIEIISNIYGSIPDIEWIEKKLHEIEYNVLNIDKAKTEFQWQPKIGIEEGIKSYYEWLKKDQNI